MLSRNIYAARVTKSGLLRRLKSASGRQTPCRVKSLLCVGCAAKKRHGGLRRRIKESRCRDFSLSPKAGRLDPSLPHRPTGAIIRHAPFAVCDPCLSYSATLYIIYRDCVTGCRGPDPATSFRSAHNLDYVKLLGECEFGRWVPRPPRAGGGWRQRASFRG